MGECIFNVFSCEIVYLEQGIEGSDVFIQLSLSCYDLELCIRDFRIYITRSRLCYEGLPYIHVQICVMYRVDINSRKSLQPPSNAQCPFLNVSCLTANNCDKLLSLTE